VLIQLHLSIPDSLDIQAEDIRLLLATTLYGQGRISLGQGAEMAGLSKRAFLEVIGTHGVSVFNQAPESLAADLGNAGFKMPIGTNEHPN
jgi:predicted HTH domain antitoxin